MALKSVGMQCALARPPSQASLPLCLAARPQSTLPCQPPAHPHTSRPQRRSPVHNPPLPPSLCAAPDACPFFASQNTPPQKPFMPCRQDPLATSAAPSASWHPTAGASGRGRGGRAGLSKENARWKSACCAGTWHARIEAKLAAVKVRGARPAEMPGRPCRGASWRWREAPSTRGGPSSRGLHLERLVRQRRLQLALYAVQPAQHLWAKRAAALAAGNPHAGCPRRACRRRRFRRRRGRQQRGPRDAAGEGPAHAAPAGAFLCSAHWRRACQLQRRQRRAALLRPLLRGAWRGSRDALLGTSLAAATSLCLQLCWQAAAAAAAVAVHPLTARAGRRALLAARG